MTDITPNEPDQPDAVADIIDADPANAQADADQPEPERPRTLEEQKAEARQAIEGDADEPDTA
jgi:hypothetical protein